MTEHPTHESGKVKPFPGATPKSALCRPDEFPVALREQDCDAILAALEAALNARLDFGPGIPAHIVEEAGRRIEEARNA